MFFNVFIKRYLSLAVLVLLLGTVMNQSIAQTTQVSVDIRLPNSEIASSNMTVLARFLAYQKVVAADQTVSYLGLPFSWAPGGSIRAGQSSVSINVDLSAALATIQSRLPELDASDIAFILEVDCRSCESNFMKKSYYTGNGVIFTASSSLYMPLSNLPQQIQLELVRGVFVEGVVKMKNNTTAQRRISGSIQYKLYDGAGQEIADVSKVFPAFEIGDVSKGYQLLLPPVEYGGEDLVLSSYHIHNYAPQLIYGIWHYTIDGGTAVEADAEMIPVDYSELSLPDFTLNDVDGDWVIVTGEIRLEDGETAPQDIRVSPFYWFYDADGEPLGNTVGQTVITQGGSSVVYQMRFPPSSYGAVQMVHYANIWSDAAEYRLGFQYYNSGTLINENNGELLAVGYPTPDIPTLILKKLDTDLCFPIVAQNGNTVFICL